MCEESALPYLGCSIRSLNDQPGMEIMLVNSDSPGSTSGMRAGDILLEIEGQVVNNISDYRMALTKAVLTDG